VKKLAAARDAILKSPLRIKADKLLTFAEKGTVQSWGGGGNDAFQVTYTIHLIVTDFAGALQDLLYVTLQWMRADCPGIETDALKFHVDVIDHKSADVSLSLEITEIIGAVSGPKGIKLEPVSDLDPEDFDMDRLAGGTN
jgi:hypothetical protein